MWRLFREQVPVYQPHGDVRRRHPRLRAPTELLLHLYVSYTVRAGGAPTVCVEYEARATWQRSRRMFWLAAHRRASWCVFVCAHAAALEWFCYYVADQRGKDSIGDCCGFAKCKLFGKCTPTGSGLTDVRARPQQPHRPAASHTAARCVAGVCLVSSACTSSRHHAWTTQVIHTLSLTHAVTDPLPWLQAAYPGAPASSPFHTRLVQAATRGTLGLPMLQDASADERHAAFTSAAQAALGLRGDA